VQYLVNDGQMLFAGCAFSNRGCGCSELDGKALFAGCGVSKRGHECSASKRTARTARCCVQAAEF
jgi:hypothetical protein